MNAVVAHLQDISAFKLVQGFFLSFLLHSLSLSLSLAFSVQSVLRKCRTNFHCLSLLEISGTPNTQDSRDSSFFSSNDNSIWWICLAAESFSVWPQVCPPFLTNMDTEGQPTQLTFLSNSRWFLRCFQQWKWVCWQSTLFCRRTEFWILHHAPPEHRRPISCPAPFSFIQNHIGSVNNHFHRIVLMNHPGSFLCHISRQLFPPFI